MLGLIPEADGDKTAWLRGKMENNVVEVMKMDNSGWKPIEDSLPSGITWDGGKPVPDINTDRKLFIKKSTKTLAVEKGSYEKGFLCEYKPLVEKKGMKKYILQSFK